jgi:acyl carrier protein
MYDSVSLAEELKFLNETQTDSGKRPISSMNDVLTRVQTAFKSAFDVDPQTISVNTTPDDVTAWDSMGHVTLASSLEKEFGLTFDVDDLMEMENVKEICRIVESKLGKVGNAQLS